MTPPGLFRITLKNCLCRPIRSCLLVLCVSSVVGLVVASELIDQAGALGLKNSIARLGADLVALPRGLSSQAHQSFAAGQPDIFYMKKDVQDRIQSLDFVKKTSSQRYIRSLDGGSCCTAWNIFLIGFDPETDFTITPWVHQMQNRALNAMEIWVGPAIQVDVGESLKFYGQTFRVAGILSKSRSFMDQSVFIPVKGVQKMIRESKTLAERTLSMGEDDISVVLIRLKPEKEGGLPVWKAAYKLEAAINDISILKPVDMVNTIRKNLDDTMTILHVAGYAAWPVTILFISLFFAMIANERKREIGLLCAIGARRGFIFQSLILESAIISVSGAALGCCLVLAIITGFQEKIGIIMGVPIQLPGMAGMVSIVISGIGIAVITGMVAATLPALRACSMEPYEAIRRVD